MSQKKSTSSMMMTRPRVSRSAAKNRKRVAAVMRDVMTHPRLANFDSSNMYHRNLAKSLALARLPATNFPWSEVIDAFLDTGSRAGDYLYPGVGTGFKIGKEVYDRNLKKVMFPTSSTVKKAEQELEKVERKEVKKEIKKEARKEGVRLASRPSVNMVTAPIQIAYSGDTVTYHGCDVIELMNSGSGVTTGAVLISKRINPLSMGGEFMRSVASKFEMWSPVDISFHLVGGAGTDEPGSLVSVFDYDPDDLEWGSTLDGDEELVRSAITHHGAKVSALWEGFTHSMEKRDEFTTRYFTGDDAAERRLTDAGRFYVIAAQAIAASVPIGTLYCSWTINFHVRSDDNQGPTGDGLYLSSTDIKPATKLGSSTTTTIMNFGLTPIAIDYAGGYLTLPAGNYVVHENLHSPVGGGISGIDNPITYVGGGSVDDPSKGYFIVNGTNSQMSSKWIVATSSFKLGLNQFNTASTFTSVTCQAYVSAAAKGPFNTSLKEYKRLAAIAASGKDQAEKLRQIDEAKQQIVASQSVSSTSSSSSSSCSSIPLSTSTPSSSSFDSSSALMTSQTSASNVREDFFRTAERYSSGTPKQKINLH